MDDSVNSPHSQRRPQPGEDGRGRSYQNLGTSAMAFGGAVTVEGRSRGLNAGLTLCLLRGDTDGTRPRLPKPDMRA